MKHTNSICALLLTFVFCPVVGGSELALPMPPPVSPPMSPPISPPISPPRVLATIKPLHSIAVAVTDGISQPDLLLDGNISPHLFQAKPSLLRSVSKADVVVWAGEGVERFLPAMVDNLNQDAVMISMAGHAAIQHPVRDKHSEHGHYAEHSKEQAEGQYNEDYGELDFHFWLDPQNALHLVNALATKLSLMDPHNADQYHSNAAAFVQNLGSTIEEIETVLSEAEGQRYLIYHDSLQYLEKAFGLGDAVIIAPKPQVQAGGKRLRALRSTVAEQQVGCLISEPQFQSSVVESIAADLGVQPVLVDPLATGFTTSGDLYSKWLLDLATTLANCFVTTNIEER